MRFLLIAVFIFIAQKDFCQHILRRADFGLALYNQIPDSIISKAKLKQTSGALIKELLPYGRATTLKLKTHDLIIKLNDENIVSTKDFIVYAKKCRGGQDVTITYIRNNKKHVVTGKLLAKPIETSNEMTIEYGEFAFESTYVRTIFKSPKNKIAKATVYFIHGIGCYSLDNLQKNDPTKLAIDEMVKNGYNVYTVEKLGTGDSYYNCSCNEIGFDKELEVFTEGYKNLLKLKGITEDKVFIFGHSLGGVTAPLVAQHFKPKGIMVFGTGFKPWCDYLLDAYLIQSSYFGFDLSQLRDTVEMCKPYISNYFYGKKSIEEISQSTKGYEALKIILGYDSVSKLASAARSPQFHKEINSHNLASAWKKINTNVLAMYGEADIAANNDKDHRALVDYYNSIYPNKATFWLVPKTNHTFQEIGTMQDYIKMQDNPMNYQKFASEHFNYQLFEKITNWMNSLL